MAPTFFTGRRTYTACFIFLSYLVLMVLMRNIALIEGKFLGAEIIRHVLFIELFSVFIVLLVACALQSGLSFVERRNSKRLCFWYGISTFFTSVIPVFGFWFVAIALRVYIILFDKKQFLYLTPYRIIQRTIPMMCNAVIIGAIALIVLYCFGILAALIAILLVYPVLLYLSVTPPFADFVPYAATSYFYKAEPRTLWAVIFIICATFVWAGGGSWLRKIWQKSFVYSRRNKLANKQTINTDN